LFKFRDKNEVIGVLLGGVCFVPSFFIVLALSMAKHLIWRIILLALTQCLWLTSISLCTRSLEIENRKLKEELKQVNEK
jgi:hypothetical protein